MVSYGNVCLILYRGLTVRFSYWTDEFLIWNPIDYNNITTILVPRSQIWIPDVTRIDVYEIISLFTYTNNFSVDLYQPLPDDMSLVVITSDGHVSSSVDQLLTVYCEFHIILYPFDTQNCTIHYEPWASTSKEVSLTARIPTDLANYMPNNGKSKWWWW